MEFVISALCKSWTIHLRIFSVGNTTFTPYADWYTQLVKSIFHATVGKVYFIYIYCRWSIFYTYLLSVRYLVPQINLHKRLSGESFMHLRSDYTALTCVRVICVNDGYLERRCRVSREKTSLCRKYKKFRFLKIAKLCKMESC